MGKKKDESNSNATSNLVYVMDKDYGWVPAELLDQNAETARVKIHEYEGEEKIISDGGKTAKRTREEQVKLKHYPGKSLPLQNMIGDKLNLKEDMVDLPFLHEAAILYNIKARHIQALPYTRTGDIIIAVNPYQWLTHLYTEKEQIKYAQKLVWESNETDPRRAMPPHVFETSALAYKGMAAEGVAQSILVSGESGAGKTETVKICMSHMASLQAGPKAKETGNTKLNIVVQRVVDSNPLLESFGNAKTRRNDNSSRFGKYIQLQFDRDDRPDPGQRVPVAKLAGSLVDVYLLEKSRVVQHDATERTYHVLYQLLDAKDSAKAEVWPYLKGKHFKDFKYIGDTDFRTIEGKSDGEHYELTLEGLALVGVKGDKLMTLMRAVAAVIGLGNLVFGKKNGDSESSSITNQNEFGPIAELLGIPEKELELGLTERTMVARGETFKVPLNAEAAKESCDAFAKEIYSKLFLWLVREINDATCAELNYGGTRKSDFTTVGLLDIFGFESFPINGYEQLCINYANEKLQQKFTRDIFQTVQEEYKFEGIALDDITYDDNSDVLQLIESRNGLLAMLNEESIRPKGSDKEFVFKAINGNKASPCLIADRLMGPLDFGIHHYAGKVVYHAAGFLVRNQDSLAGDLHSIAKKSSNDILANHLANEAMMNGELSKPIGAGPKRGKSGMANDTLWTKFKSQLTNLMASLNETQSRYIRCIKPNTLKKPLIMMHMTTVEQLRCAGVVAAVTISRSAFPNRLDHRACLERFKVLLGKRKKGHGKKKDDSDPKEAVQKMCDTVLAPLEKDGKKAYVVGKTRVYFRLGALEFMETERMKGWDTWALDIQRVTRGWLVRRKNGGRRMQKKGPRAIPIQCAWRCYVARKKLKKLKKVKKLKKKNDKKKRTAAIKIQAIARGWLWRPKFKDMIKSKREKDGLKNKIRDLENSLKEAEKSRQKEVEEARAAAEEEMELYRAKVKKELANDKEKEKKSAQQQTLIDESGKIIEYLRKENMKLRNQNDSMRKDFKALKENNQRLMEANASAGESFQALNDHAKHLNATNAKLIKNVEGYKAQLEKMKDDLKTRQAYYLAEAEARLAYQKTMAQIVGAIQDKCRDAQLVEDVVIMALECEAEAKSERAALDSAGKKKTEAASQPSLAKSSVSAEDDSDDDSD